MSGDRGLQRDLRRFLIAHLADEDGIRVLPKNGSPPFQTVIFFPGANAFQLRSSRDMPLESVDFVVQSGRTLFYPIYKGTYERQTPEPIGSNAARDLDIAWFRDLGRAIDYLERYKDR